MTFDEVGGTGESSREVVTFPALATSMTEPHFSAGTGVYHINAVCGSASGTMHTTQNIHNQAYHIKYTWPIVPHTVYMALLLVQYPPHMVYLAVPLVRVTSTAGMTGGAEAR